MFTGLIQSKGKILRVENSGDESRLTVQPLTPFKNYVKGESIALNGVCLTVESFEAFKFSAYASSETMRLTNLGGLIPGAEVNLERAVRLGDRLGGHLVSGHVDGLCEVVSASGSGSSVVYRFSFPARFARQIVPKGSVAVDGVSLTVNACGDDYFEANVIPATQIETTIGSWKPGRQINLETDLIGKYVERMLGCFTGGENAAKQPGLTLEFFRGNGF